MSNQSPFGRAAKAFPTLPHGDVLGTFETYAEAQRLIAVLAAADFPVGKLSIVGNDLKTVERVTGKLTYGRAALAGALSGLWLGIFFGIVLTLFSSQASGLIFAAALIGAAFGVLYGVVSFSVTKRQHDYTSVHQVLASNYQIVCDPELAGAAQRILDGATRGPAGGTFPTGVGAPPRNPRNPTGPTASGSPDASGSAAPHEHGSPYGSDASQPVQQPAPDRSGQSAASGGLRDAQGRPRYGTNEGPRYGETAGAPTGESAAPSGADDSAANSGAASAPDPDEPPRYGERLSDKD